MGRSSSAAATNSSCSNVLVFVALEVAVPLQNSMGDGLYIMWACLMLILYLIVLVVLYKEPLRLLVIQTIGGLAIH